MVSSMLYTLLLYESVPESYMNYNIMIIVNNFLVYQLAL